MSLLEVLPKGPVRRVLTKPGEITVRIRPSNKIVEFAIHEAMGKLGWILDRRTERLGETIMDFKRS